MNRMRELREERGITMKEAANALGMPYTTYVNYEKGVREPNSETLIKIADFYNTTIDYLVNRSSAHFSKEERLSIEEFHIVSLHYQYILRTHRVNIDKLIADTNISVENLNGLANDQFCEISKSQIEKLAHSLGVSLLELTAPTKEAIDYIASEKSRIHKELEQEKIPFIKTTFNGKNPFSNENISSGHPAYPQIDADFMFIYDKQDAKTIGIEKDDLIWAKKATQANNGDRVVMTYQHKIYIRRIYYQENHTIILSSDNTPVIIDAGSERNWKLIGIVTLIGRAYHGDIPPDQL